MTFFKVIIKPTKKEFELLKYLDKRIYIDTAEKRFTLLEHDYLSKKYSEEKFPAEGNYKLGYCLYQHIKNNIEEWVKKKKIKVLDIGSGGGALTTIFAIKALDKLKLLEKTKIILFDVSEDALQSTLDGSFYLPMSFLKKYGLQKIGKNGKWLKKILKEKSEYIVGDIVNLPSSIKNVDICLSGFTHHHLNIFDKKLACEAMEGVTNKGGFIGLVDESLNYKQYLKWLKAHKNEINSQEQRVPIAQESFIQLDLHKSFFKNIDFIYNKKEKEYYYFCGVKN